MESVANNQALKSGGAAYSSRAGAKVHCAHCLCQEEERNLYFNQALSAWFCCKGCEAVFEFIKKEGFSSYYTSLEEAHNQLEFEPSLNLARPEREEFYQAWNSPDFLKLYGKKQSEQNSYEIQFYVEGIRCVACTWLLDRLPKKFPQLLEVKSSFASQLLVIKFKKDEIDLKQLGQYVAKLGYRLHPLEGAGEAHKWRLKEDRRELLRFGTSAFFSSQIMILVVAIYGGADGEWIKYFEWAIFALSLPVFFYAAAPFYLNAFKQIKNGYLGLDSSMSIALIFGFSLSFYHLLHNQRAQYFDSISMFVTLILGARYLARKLNQHGLNIDFIPHHQSSELYQRSQGGGWIKARKINENDEFEVAQGQMIPVDSQLLSTQAYISMGQINGEGRALELKYLMPLTSGSINLGQKIKLRAQKGFQTSYLGLYLKRLTQSWQDKTKILNLSDKVASYLIITSVLLSLFTFWFHYSSLGFVSSLERALAILIVTCPCALALGTPLAFTLALKKLLAAGIFVKTPEALEKIEQLKNIFFDKTGTLSLGEFSLLNFPTLSEADWRAIYALASNSSHPLAKTICLELSRRKYTQALEIIDFQEIPGQGVQAIVAGNFYEFKKALSHGENLGAHTLSAVYKNGVLLTELAFIDQVRPLSAKLIALLKRNYNVFLLSGDRSSVVKDFARQIGIEQERALGDQSPSDKARVLADSRPCMMIGDGLNDALSFSKADVAISFGEALALSQKSADVVVSSGQLASLLYLIKTAKRIFETTKVNILISLVYNLAGFILAFQGFVDPFKAALLMPLSSLTIITHSYLKMYFLKEKAL